MFSRTAMKHSTYKVKNQKKKNDSLTLVAIVYRIRKINIICRHETTSKSYRNPCLKSSIINVKVSVEGTLKNTAETSAGGLCQKQ
jgi:hypothetical protein